MFSSSFFCSAQSYEFGIVHVSNYDFKVVAIPDFDSAGNTDVSDVGFTLVLPTGSVDITNPVGLLTSRTWTVQEFDAAFLTGQGLGDGTKDVFQFNLSPGQSILAHTTGQQIDLVSFQITNSPVTGSMSFLLNSDPIATGAGDVLDSFYNSDIDGTGTEDYFSAPASGLDNFMFSTLSLEELILDDSSISVYPNPAENWLTINGDYSNINSVEIYSMSGQLVIEITNDFGKIDTGNLQSGIYFLKVKTDTLNKTIKFIKE